MPRIQSRLHVDELRITRQALAETGEENSALRRRVEQQQRALDDAETQNKSLREQLARSHDDVNEVQRKLTEVQAHYEGRERRLQDQVQRMELDIHTLEEMVQAARRREAANTKEPCEACVELRKELQRTQEEVQRCSSRIHANRESSRESIKRFSSPPRVAPAPSAGVPKSFSINVTPSPSSRSFYWQEQLLDTTQQAAACFSVVHHHTQDLFISLNLNMPENEMGARKELLAFASANTLEDSADRWHRQLQHLQSAFDEVVQADAKLISFLVLVAEQQSGQIQQLQQKWSEAQLTVQEAEKVLDEAQTRMQQREQEVKMLRDECAALTEAQLRYQTRIQTQMSEIQTRSDALQQLEHEHNQYVETHSRQVEVLTARHAKAIKLQQQATSYAHKLEAALQEKQQLLERAVAARNEQKQQELLAVIEARVAQFVAQLSRSAQQLKSSLVHLSSSLTAETKDTLSTNLAVVRPLKTALSVSSPEPSPPDLRSDEGMSMSPSVTRTVTRSSAPFDDSIFLADITQPFSPDD